MKTLHLHTTIESETLHLPELRPFIGHAVEITVQSSSEHVGRPRDWLPGFWEAISKGWQGEPLVRPDQGTCDVREALP